MPKKFSRSRLLLLTLAALVGCKRGEASDPPQVDPVEDGEGAEGGGEDGAGGALEPGAIDAMGPQISAEKAEARERKKPADPKTRDAALIAAAHGNPDGAAAFLSEHFAKKKSDHEAGFALSRAQRLIGELDAAENTLEQIKKHNKDKAVQGEALRRLAHLRETRGDAAGAEKHLRAARKLDPDSLLLKGELVRLMFEIGKADDAEIRGLIDDLYAAYGDGTAQTAEQLLGASYAALAERAFKSTSRVLQEAEALSPPSKGEALGDEVNMALAALFLEKYKPKEAAGTLALVLERDPWNPEALAMMGWVALDEFQLAAASRAADEALQVNPESADAHAVLAWVAMIEGRREEARERVVDHVLPINPAHAGGQMVMAALAIFERDDKAYAKARDAVLAYNPKNGQFFSGLGDLLGYLHLYPEADRVLSEGAQRLPEDPYVQAGLGLSRLRLGDETTGRAALEKAWKKDKYNNRTLNVRQLYSERIEPHYAEQVHGDLTLRLPAELQELLAPGYVEAITTARKALDKGYGIKISPLRIEMYAEPDEFSIRTVGVPSLGAVGVCFGHTITSIGPYMGTHNFNQVIWHEIAHSYAIELSEGRVPRWFTEGLSEWESEVADPSWARESAALLYEARRQDKLRKLSELELAFLRAESPIMMEVAYSTAAWAMRYLGETYGRPKIVEILKGYAKGKSTEQLFVEVLGKDMATVEKDFEAWFDAELDRKLSGWRPDPKAKDDPRMKAFEKVLETAAGGDLDQAKALVEKLIAAKGDGFQTRMTLATIHAKQGDHKAAAKQYEKAASFASESIDPLVGMAKLARDQGDLARELDVLERILAIDGMSMQPAVRMLVLAAALGDKRFEDATKRAQAIAPLHPTVTAAMALLEHRSKQKGAKHRARVAALLDESMTIALRPDATLDVIVMAALAAEEIGDPRVKDLAPRALESKELPDRARKLLKKHAP